MSRLNTNVARPPIEPEQFTAVVRQRNEAREEVAWLRTALGRAHHALEMAGAHTAKTAHDREHRENGERRP